MPIMQRITKAQVENEMILCDSEIAILESQRDALTRKKEALKVLWEVQSEIDDGARMLPPTMPALESLRVGAKQEGKPATAIIEDILLEYGPMHISDIIAIGRERGVSFLGKSSPQRMARNKLDASQRFVLLDTNVWGLPIQQEDYIAARSKNGRAPKKQMSMDLGIAR